MMDNKTSTYISRKRVVVKEAPIITAGETITIDAVAETSTSLDITTTSTVEDVRVTVVEYNANPVGGVNAPELNKFIEITPTENLGQALESAIIKVYYIDEEVAGIDESKLALFVYDGINNRWDIIEDSGVNTEDNYVWARTTHFSTVALNIVKYGAQGFVPGPTTQTVTVGSYVTYIIEIKNTGTVEDTYQLSISGVPTNWYAVLTNGDGVVMNSITLRGGVSAYIQLRVAPIITTQDIDGDGLNNGEEIATYGTSPLSVDTDGDGLNDKIELDYWNSRTDGIGWNSDVEVTARRDGGDGLINILDPDTDNDGLLDGTEVNGWNIYINGISTKVSSDPIQPDTDNDGFSDKEERDGFSISINNIPTLVYSDPSSGDTDGDGISDFDEILEDSNPSSTYTYNPYVNDNEKHSSTTRCKTRTNSDNKDPNVNIIETKHIFKSIGTFYEEFQFYAGSDDYTVTSIKIYIGIYNSNGQATTDVIKDIKIWDSPGSTSSSADPDFTYTTLPTSGYIEITTQSTPSLTLGKYVIDFTEIPTAVGNYMKFYIKDQNNNYCPLLYNDPSTIVVVETKIKVDSNTNAYLVGGAYADALSSSESYVDNIKMKSSSDTTWNLLYEKAFSQGKFNFPLGSLTAGNTYDIYFEWYVDTYTSPWAKLFYQVTSKSFDPRTSPKTSWDTIQITYDGTSRTADYDCWGSGVAINTAATLSTPAIPAVIRRSGDDATKETVSFYVTGEDPSYSESASGDNDGNLKIYLGATEITTWSITKIKDYAGGIYVSGTYSLKYRETWKVTVPSGASVGKYSLKMYKADDTTSLGERYFFVIFNPWSYITDEDFVATYVYDEDFDGGSWFMDGIEVPSIVGHRLVIDQHGEINAFGGSPEHEDCLPTGSTNANTADTDNDGLPDYVEVYRDYDSYSPGIQGTNPCVKDTDGDGWTDGTEIWHFGSNPIVPSLGVLAIVVNFNDLPTTYDYTHFNNLLFDKNEWQSLHNYYWENSYGTVDIVGDVVRVTLDLPESDYGYDTTTTEDSNLQGLITEAFTKIANIDTTPLIKYSKVRGGVRIIDYLMVIFAGPGQEDNPTVTGRLWSAMRIRNVVYQKDTVSFGVNRVATVSEMRGVGGVCHEFGHLAFDLPDLYDYNNQNNFPVGGWDLMANGGRFTPPSSLSAWSKIYAGWSEPRIVSSTTEIFRLYPAETATIGIHAVKIMPYAAIYLGSEQYYLIEYRRGSQQTTFTSDPNLAIGTPGAEGVIIWRVDESDWKNIENEIKNGNYPDNWYRPNDDGKLITSIMVDGWGRHLVSVDNLHSVRFETIHEIIYIGVRDRNLDDGSLNIWVNISLKGS